MTDDLGYQGPTTGKPAVSIGVMLSIVQHPAFRIGFLDAQSGRELDHDNIMSRIEKETNARALKRIGWAFRRLGGMDTEVAQYRYEEGRLAVKEYGIRCKAWGHPDYPPAQVYRLCRRLADERAPGA